MKRLCVLLLALALAVFMAAPAFATWTRVVTMGNQVMYGQDDYNIWGFTSTVNNYPRHLIIDHSVDPGDLAINPGVTDLVTGNTRVGMIVPFMKNMVLGAFISDFARDYVLGPAPTAFTDGASDQKIDLFWGYRAANFDLGVRIDYYGEGLEFSGKAGESQFGLNAGVGFNLSGNMLEANVSYSTLSYTDEAADGTTPVVVNSEQDGGSDIGLNARYLIAYNSMVTLVPAFSYRAQSLSEQATLGNTGLEVSSTAWDLGFGCNTVPLQGTEFLTSIGVRSLSTEANDTSAVVLADFSDGHMPYLAIGTEIQVKNWLNFRFGAEKTWDGFTDNTTTPETKASGASFDYMVGAGVMVGDLQFDLEVNPSWFNNGPHFLSGNTTSPMFGWVSIKYDYR